LATIVMLTEFFLLSLALGVGFFSFLANTKETGAGFLKIVSGLCGSSSLVALILHLTYGSYLDKLSILYYVSLISFLLIYLGHRDEKSVFMWILFGVHNIALTILLFIMNNENFQEFFFSFTSVMFLGSVTYHMVMGHWYLVTPRLSEKPLKIALYFMWIFMAVKCVWTGIGYLGSSDFFINGTVSGGGYAFNWMMLLMRTGWGYVVLGIMSYFAYRLVAMRSIQSATGMLYAMTFFVFVGELVSNYMFYQYGVHI
jgi:hypothetical protein